MIPARGGSRGVPRKNVRLLAGLPLITHVVRTAIQRCDPSNVIVITDDDEIDMVSRTEGIRVFREPPTTGRATLDDVALKVASELVTLGASDNDIFLTMQPTCPFVRTSRIDEAIAALEDGAGSVITVVDDRHLGWRIDSNGAPYPDYQNRVNRQLLPPQFRESGAIIGCRLQDLKKHQTRILEPIRLIEVGQDESLDIDDFSGWAIAEYHATRRNIVLRADASELLGMGHVYRTLAMAQELARHRILIATNIAMPLGATLLKESPFEVTEVDGDEGFLKLIENIRPDLTILDQLDTKQSYVETIQKSSGRVVTFEDQGSGADAADLLVSDLYKNLSVPNDRQLTGISNAILAPSFETAAKPQPFKDTANHVLIVFGGTDPAHLTEKALQALAHVRFAGTVSVVLGPGVSRSISLENYGLKGEIHRNVKFMAALMEEADIAVSSGGRTVTELICLGVPVLCLCQNEKELTHTHASARYGVVNLGLGELVEIGTLAAHIERLVNSSELRKVLHLRALHETSERSNAAIIQRMVSIIGWKQA